MATEWTVVKATDCPELDLKSVGEDQVAVGVYLQMTS